MEISKAAELISLRREEGIQQWADLGCGQGTFTYALASHLTSGSTIYAVDQEDQQLIKNYNEVQVSFIQNDFVSGLATLPAVHGVLMANSLHYVEDQCALIMELEQKVALGARRLVIVEYDTGRSNYWVPYPINLKHLTSLVRELGFSIQKIGEASSRYQGMMYAAEVTFKDGNYPK